MKYVVFIIVAFWWYHVVLFSLSIEDLYARNSFQGQGKVFTISVGCNYMSLSLIHASSTQVFNSCHYIKHIHEESITRNERNSVTHEGNSKGYLVSALSSNCSWWCNSLNHCDNHQEPRPWTHTEFYHVMDKSLIPYFFLICSYSSMS